MTTKKTIGKEYFEVSGFKAYTLDDAAIRSMPPSTGVATVELFSIGRYATPQEVADEYEKHGLTPAPLELLATHAKDAAFADANRFTAAQWKNEDGQWCYIAFSRWSVGGRRVIVDRDSSDWHGDWAFAGVRKSALGAEAIGPGTQASALGARDEDAEALRAAIALCKENGLVVYRPL